MTEVLEKLGTLSAKSYADGEFVESKATDHADVIDPATEKRIGQIAMTPLEEVDAVIDVSRAAQDKWKRLAALDRATFMHKVADRMAANDRRFAEALTREMGKPFKEALDEVHWSVHSIRYNAEIARNDTGRVMGNATEGQFHYTLKQPLGVAALIMPFNYPLVLLSWEAGAALAAGCSVVVKPSEYTSLCTLLFAEAFADLPDGVFQVVTGGGDVGRHMVEHEHTHVVVFTGSVPIGQSVAETCGRLMKRSLIETSGNDPFLIMPSAPMDITARAANFSAFMNCGQICVSAERFYVHDDIHDAFVAKLVEQAETLRIGNGLERVDMGPMVSAKERDRYERLMKKARDQGAMVATGGGRPSEFNQGWFVQPTVLTDCTPEMDIFHEESFGPVAPICRVKSFDAALEHANNSRFGLGANIYTRDLSEAIRGTEELQAGMVWVNAPLLDNDAGPFGGSKLSGMGRQLGPDGVDTFRETKMIMIDPDCAPQDFWWFPYQDAESFPGQG
ncbi:MAG: aldehyde dehydrogenase family protein [Pseudomonadota bacterium]